MATHAMGDPGDLERYPLTEPDDTAIDHAALRFRRTGSVSFPDFSSPAASTPWQPKWRPSRTRPCVVMITTTPTWRAMMRPCAAATGRT